MSDSTNSNDVKPQQVLPRYLCHILDSMPPKQRWADNESRTRNRNRSRSPDNHDHVSKKKKGLSKSNTDMEGMLGKDAKQPAKL